MFWIIFLLVLTFGFVVFFGAPYVPSKKSDLKRAFEELYPISESDTLVDIGSGDGVVLRYAASKGARAVGYEINPILVIISRILAYSSPNVITHFGSFWSATLPAETTVVYTFGDSRDIVKMAEKVQQTANLLGRPLAFISYGFAIPDTEARRQVGAHYLYKIVPLQMDRA